MLRDLGGAVVEVFGTENTGHALTIDRQPESPLNLIVGICVFGKMQPIQECSTQNVHQLHQQRDMQLDCIVISSRCQSC